MLYLVRNSQVFDSAASDEALRHLPEPIPVLRRERTAHTPSTVHTHTHTHTHATTILDTVHTAQSYRARYFTINYKTPENAKMDAESFAELVAFHWQDGGLSIVESDSSETQV